MGLIGGTVDSDRNQMARADYSSRTPLVSLCLQTAPNSTSTCFGSVSQNHLIAYGEWTSLRLMVPPQPAKVQGFRSWRSRFRCDFDMVRTRAGF